jgi:uncharacterized membrane protein YphA (DoxX/SURF4 family)
MIETATGTITNGSAGRVLLVLGRVALAGILLFAAYAKLKPQVPGMHWSTGSMNVDSFEMLGSPRQVSIVAHLLPFCEIGLGLWLLSGILLRFSSVIATLVFAGFFTVIVRTYMLGLEINCGCFGPGEKLGPRNLVIDGSLLALAIAVTVGAFLSRRKSGLEGAPSGSPATLGAD